MAWGSYAQSTILADGFSSAQHRNPATAGRVSCIKTGRRWARLAIPRSHQGQDRIGRASRTCVRRQADANGVIKMGVD
jgi:hypothetical protein